MSRQDLITKWEEALTRAVSPSDRQETLSERDLEAAAGIAVRSSVRAADDPSTQSPICQTFASFC